MEFQAGRAHRYYDIAEACLPANERRNMLVSEIMKNIYYQLLIKIENQQYNVLDNAIRLSTPAKAVVALKTVSRIKLLG
jgi:phytoene synthase